MTKYPAQIDTSVTLPSAVDNFTPVAGATVNRLRDAVLAIEAELGVKPSGIYSTVTGRLTAIENNVANLQIIELAGDLGNTLAAPYVVGIWGRPVSSVTPNPTEVLTWDGIAWVPGANAGSIVFSGDLSGTGVSQKVVGLEGRPLSNTAPSIGQVLQWNGTFWVPTTLAAATFPVTSITTNYPVITSDYEISVGTLSSAITITLLASPAIGTSYIIKYANGSATAHNITINGNGHNIDNVSSFVINQNYGSLTVIFNGTTWSII